MQNKSIGTNFQFEKQTKPGLGMTRRRQPVPALSPAQIKKKEAWAGDEKPALRQSCVGWYRQRQI